LRRIDEAAPPPAEVVKTTYRRQPRRPGRSSAMSPTPQRVGGLPAGKSVEDAASADTFPPKYAGYRAPQPDSVKNNIEIIYAELK
jgi:hypothetical protein